MANTNESGSLRTSADRRDEQAHARDDAGLPEWIFQAQAVLQVMGESPTARFVSRFRRT